MSPREEQRFAVLLEQVRSDVKLVAEGLTMLDQKVDRGFREVHQELAQARADIQHLAVRFNTHTHGH